MTHGSMKLLSFSLILLLSGCGKFGQTLDTVKDGYAIRCINDTSYIIVSSESGVAITPLLGKDGLPKTCN